MNFFTRLGMLLMMALFSASASAESVELNAIGASTTVTATIEPNAAALGKPVNIWISAVYKGAPYFYNGTAWVPYTGGAFPIAMKDKVLSPSTTFLLLQDADLATLPGAALYVGWGTNEGDMQTSAGKLRKIHQIGKSYPWPKRPAQ